jgi:hypothetical protein
MCVATFNMTLLMDCMNYHMACCDGAFSMDKTHSNESPHIRYSPFSHNDHRIPLHV